MDLPAFVRIPDEVVILSRVGLVAYRKRPYTLETLTYTVALCIACVLCQASKSPLFHDRISAERRHRRLPLKRFNAPYTTSKPREPLHQYSNEQLNNSVI